MKKSIPLYSLVCLLLFGLLILIVNRYTEMDVGVSKLFFNYDSNSFPLQSSPFLDKVMHHGLKYLSFVIWFALLIAVIRHTRSRRARNPLPMEWYVLLAPLACTLLVSVLKSHSVHSCPWDLAPFGGTAPYLRLMDVVPLGESTGPARCFPSGHASVGWMWIPLMYAASSLVFLPRIVWVALGVLVLGAAVSITQVVKGAHFVSHVMATAWVCWVLALLLYSFTSWLFVKSPRTL